MANCYVSFSLIFVTLTSICSFENEYSDNHRFFLLDDSDFEKDIVKHVNFGDAVYFLLGHPTNDEANKLQLKSYYALSRRLNQIPMAVKAASINKDLSQAQQHYEHVDQSYWTSSEWLIDYGKEELGVSIDSPIQETGHDFDFLGIIVHSWDDCIKNDDDDDDDEISEFSICLHVSQVRNYGHYFPQNVSKELLAPVFKWIANDLVNKGEMPTVVVFQEFDTDHEWLAKSVYDNLMAEQRVFTQNLVAVVFSLMTRNVTLSNNICYRHGAVSAKAPLLSFTQMPDRGYFAFQFNPSTVGAKKVFRMEVKNDTHTVVMEVDKNINTCL